MALGAVHAAYPMIAGRFKDYISTPKANGYQSLHTGVTLQSPRNQKIEVQIRTPDMHDVAENGVAAHWSTRGWAKAGMAARRRCGRAGCRTCWRSWRIRQRRTSSSRTPSSSSTRTRCSASRPKGQLIQLPRGATPVDFAYAVHSQVGDACVGAKVNGRLLPLRHELQNGDQVEIMTARGGTPSPAWERFVVTGKARARIRRHVAAPAARDPSRRRPCRTRQGVPPGRRRRVREGAGSRPQDAEVREPGRPLCRGRQRQPGAQGRGPAALSGAAAGAARAAHDPGPGAASGGQGAGTAARPGSP